MKKREVLIFVFIVVVLALVFGFYSGIFNLTGNVALEGNPGEVHTIGPSAAEQACMMQCMGCISPGVGCTGNSEQCQAQCNVEKPETTEETSCMETCVLTGCTEFDFECQTRNQDKCEEECDMIKEPEAKSEEEQCIRDCVNEAEPGLICQAGEGGEKGNEVCKRCAEQCVHLYSGPCLNEEKLEQKKKDCETCEHCYGAPVMGDSGEGYDCIVDVTCQDATSEFGDEPGVGEGISEAVGDVIDSIGDFFRGIFGGEETVQEDSGSSG